MIRIFPSTAEMKVTHAASGQAFEPVARSAFRVLGLTASASEREVNAAADSLRLALKLGVERSFEGDMAWLGPLVRTDAGARDAVGRLADPPRRLAERLFWFHTRVSVPRVANVNALEKASEELVLSDNPVARHDAALLMLAGLSRLDPHLREPKAWARAFELWAELVEREEFWSLLVAADLKGEYEQLATFAEVRELRARTPRLVSSPVADRAKDAAVRGDLRACRRALVVLRATRLSAPLLDEYENDTLGPVEDRVEAIVDEAFAQTPSATSGAGFSESNAQACDRAWRKFEEEAKPELFRFAELGGVRSPSVRRALGRAAAKLVELSDAYRDNSQPTQSLDVLRQAMALAPPGSSTLLQVEENLRAAGLDDETRKKGEESYAAEVTRELRARLAPEPGSGESYADIKGDSTLLGCVMQVIFYGLMVAACFMLDDCRKQRRNSRYRPTHNLNFRAPVPQFSPVPFPTLRPAALLPRVSVEELRRSVRARSVVVVDAREREAYEAGHIPGALSVPEAKAEQLRKDIPRGRPVVVYGANDDDRGADSVGLKLWTGGQPQPSVLAGGYEAWTGATPPPTPAPAAPPTAPAPSPSP